MSMQTTILVASLFIYINAFAQSFNHDKMLGVVGGHEAYPHQFPYQIGIYVNKSTFRDFCDGTLVSPYYVLTAAHCVQNAISLELIFGAHNITDREDTQLRLVSKEFWIHPDYDWLKKKADLALVRLPSAVKENEFIRIIRIADGNENFEGQRGILTGWGLMTVNQKGVTPILHYDNLDIITNEECKKAGGSFTLVINPTLMCTSGMSDEGPVGGGSGDSGGPLVVGKVQVGVLSFASRYFTEGKPTVFVKLSEYGNWLDKYLNA